MPKKPPRACSPRDFSLKSYFLAPNAENREVLCDGVAQMLDDWFEWRQLAQTGDGPFFSPYETMNSHYKREVGKLMRQVAQVSKKFGQELPRHSPRYIGHMYSEYSLPAFFGHFLALMYNPNNISSEVSRVGLRYEEEAIRFLVKMLKFPRGSRGHFTSGGTVANLEFLYRVKLAHNSDTPLTIIIPESAHYSWIKGFHLIANRDDFISSVGLDRNGRIDLGDLRRLLENLRKRKIQPAALVSVLGTTELGVLDRIDQISKILDRHPRIDGRRSWHHIDAAYGGFFCAVGADTPKSLDREEATSLKAVSRADSITLDPHKLGYVPYSSGCFICKNPRLYRSTSVSAPYLDYRPTADPGPYTMEGSRSAAGALAVWLTAKTLGLGPAGLGRVLAITLNSADAVRTAIKNSNRFTPLNVPSTNIICFVDRGPGRSLREVNRRTKALYVKIKRAARRPIDTAKQKSDALPFYVSKTILSKGNLRLIQHNCDQWGIVQDDNKMFLIRCTIMNPFFRTVHSHTDFANELIKWLRSL